MTSSDGYYVHGTDPEERRRLSLLNDLLNEQSLSALQLAGGERVLDVGSGLGQLSRSIARLVGPGGRVVGIERDAGQAEEARALAAAAGEGDLVEFRVGDATRPPLEAGEWGTFDVAHTRFLLEHVSDPQGVVDLMVQAVKPGGRVVLEDDDHDVLRLWPEPAGVYRLWRAYIQTYEYAGNDPYVGRRTVAMLLKAGTRPTRCRWLFFGACAGEDVFGAFVDNFAGVLAGARESILARTDVAAGELDEGLAAFRAWGQLPDAALWYATCWAEGRRV